MKKFPFYGWIGIILVSVFWYLNWTLTGLRTQWGFFFMWLGYSLTIDGLVYLKKGTSLIKRSIKKYLMLFIISVPTWWFFEIFNSVTENWHYIGRQYFTNFQFFLLASLSFSTVMPAVFGTAELVSCSGFITKIKIKKDLRISPATVKKYFISGCIMLLLVLLLPKYFYYLLWASLYFMLDPLNYKLGNRSLIIYAKAVNWRPLISLAAGCLICGFFWEMWNYYSYPKWIYTLPYLNYAHIFEMPLPGYIGYIPFSFELFAIYNLISMKKTKPEQDYYLQIQ